MTTIEDVQFVEVTEKIPDSSSEVMVLDSEVIEAEEISEDSNIMIIDESYFVFPNGGGGGNSEDNQDQNNNGDSDKNQDQNSDQNSDKNLDNSNSPDDQGQTQDYEDSNSDTEGDPCFDVNHDLDDKESEFIQVLKKDRTLVS